MKLQFILCVTCFSAAIAAFGTYGANERLWFYYAYLLDDAGKIFPKCGPKQEDGRCSFKDFIHGIDLNKDKMLPNKLEGVDPMNVEEAVRALQAGHYTGAYDCRLVHTDVKKRNQVATLFQSLTGFLGSKMDKAPDKLRTNLQQVIDTTTRLRMSNVFTPDETEGEKPKINQLRKQLRDSGFTLVPKQVALYQGSAEKADVIDLVKTAESKTGDGNLAQKKKDVKSVVNRYYANDQTHLNNIETAKEAAARVSQACLEARAAP